MRRFSKEALITLCEQHRIFDGITPHIEASRAAYIFASAREFEEVLDLLFDTFSETEFKYLSGAMLDMDFIFVYSEKIQNSLDALCQ